MKAIESKNDDEVKKMLIMNEKFAGGKNYLHILVSRLTKDNESEISEMIKELSRHGCSLNTLNDQEETPFHLLLKSKEVGRNLKEFFGKSQLIDFYLHKDSEDFLKELGFEETSLNPTKDAAFMIQIIEQFNEERFVKEFNGLLNFKDQLTTVLDSAIKRNLHKIVEVIVAKTEVNNKRASAFLACQFGHHQVLKVLLTDETFEFKNSDQNLLHKILEEENLHASDRLKCYDLIVADPRCTNEIINGFDMKQQTPLSYASVKGLNEIVVDLLRRGAFIGHDSVVKNIDKKFLTDFLDENIKCCDDLKDKNCEIHVDYRFLMDEKSDLEVQTLHKISKNSELKEVILHPVILSFLELKWKKINFIVYFNLLVYFCFMMFLGSFVINFFHHEVYNQERVAVTTRFGEDDSHDQGLNMLSWLFGFSSGSKRVKRSVNIEDTDDAKRWKLLSENEISYKLCFFGVILLTIYEVIQFATSYKKYFFKFNNWLDIAMISLSFVVLVKSFDFKPDHFKKIRSVMILIMAAQTIQLISKVSFLSMSLHMTIFKKVCATFLKTIALYMILILAFAMSFYTLNDRKGSGSINSIKTSSQSEENDNFSDIFVSIITTVRMMLSDFDSMKVKPEDRFEGIIFLLFMILITAVLFNLLNALAVKDTDDLMKIAEIIDTKKRILILNSYEKLFKLFNLTFANIFPQMATVIIRPNNNNKVQGVQNSGESRFVPIYETSKFDELEGWKESFRLGKTELSSKIMKKTVRFVKESNDFE